MKKHSITGQRSSKIQANTNPELGWVRTYWLDRQCSGICMHCPQRTWCLMQPGANCVDVISLIR